MGRKGIKRRAKLRGKEEKEDRVNQRCTSRAQRTVCNGCAAVPCTRARDGTARHVAGEGRAASAIGGEGERTLSKRDR
jgi:hypothetical protein